MRHLRRRLLLGGLVLSALLLVAFFAAKILVVDEPQKSDVIVILFGDFDDIRMHQALKMLRNGYAREVVLDAPDWVIYGKKHSEMAQEYIRTIAPDMTAHLHVCEFSGYSTQTELSEIAPCLHAVAPEAKRGLLVTSDYHTRRALSVARHILPGYQWSVSSTPDPVRFGIRWWQHREWAKTTLTEWQKSIWWFGFEKWKSH